MFPFLRAPVLPFGFAAVAIGCGSPASAPTAPAPAPTPAAASCGGYPDQMASAYVLPFRPGLAFAVSQGNCSSGVHAAGSEHAYAYDFRMPVGTEVVASRAGVVSDLREAFTDGNRVPGQENYVIVRHDDGTFSAYLHLTRDGVLVSVGDRVTRGQVIAHSGDTGLSTEPHLHFAEIVSGRSRPITFVNTRPHPGGLALGEVYRAEPHP